MIISDKYKLIFIKNPKTATTAIENSIIAQDPDCTRSGATPPYGHESLEEVKKLAGRKWEKYTKVAFIREPFSWFISSFNQNNFTDFSSTPAYWLYPSPSKVEGKISIEEAIRCHVMLQHYFGARGGAASYKQIHWVKGLDIVGIYENLDAHWKSICEELNMDPSLERLNVGKTTLSLSATAQMLVTILYKEDFREYLFCCKKWE